MSTVDVTFTAEQLRVAAKSVSRSIDSEASKLERLRKGSPVHDEVQRHFRVLSDVDALLRDAQRDLLGGDE
jgi:hypothetical protein